MYMEDFKLSLNKNLSIILNVLSYKCYIEFNLIFFFCIYLFHFVVIHFTMMKAFYSISIRNTLFVNDFTEQFLSKYVCVLNGIYSYATKDGFQNSNKSIF